MIKTYANFGYEGSLVTVEVDLRSGVPAVDIVGLADDAVEASRETVKAAIVNSGLKLPSERILLSLSPADMKKDNGCLAATALAVVLAGEGVATPDILVMGRLSNDGKLSYCPGIYAACETAKAQGIKYAILPDCTESALVKGMEAVLVNNLHEARTAVDAFSFSKARASDIVFSELDEDDVSLDDVHGCGELKEAMLIAACGGHHMLTVCRNDSVETRLMKHFNQLLPQLRPEERKEVYRIHSVGGLLNEYIPVNRPFIAPHPSVRIEGTCGGGVNCRPGAISYAHSGVLFLQEAQEFRGSVLQMLRVPLESNSIVLSRAGRSTMFPARFQLLMTAQGCPCGRYSTDKPYTCTCTMTEVLRYWRKLGNPLLDRVAIRVVASGEDDFMTLKEMRAVVERVWKAQLLRQGYLNEYLGKDVTEKIVDKYSRLFPEGVSIRCMHETAKVARTLADMEGRDSVEERDIINALSLHGKLPTDLVENA